MILSVVSQKGGVGKTTTAITLAAGLARKKKKVLLIDLDAQCNLSLSENVINTETTVKDVLTGEVSIFDAIVSAEQYDIIASSHELAMLELNGPNVIKSVLSPAELKYDFIILDTPPHLSLMTINAVVASDATIIIVQADLYSLHSLTQLTETISTIKAEANSNLKVLGILINRFYSRAAYSQAFAEHITQAAKDLETSIFKIPIRESVVIKEALANQISIFEYAPKANQTTDYLALIKEVLKRVK